MNDAEGSPTRSGFHELAVEDALSESHHPKIETYDGYVYLILHGIDFEESQHPFATHDVDFFLGTTFLVTVHDGTSRSVARIREVCSRNEQILAEGPGGLLYRIIDTMVDNYRPEVEKLEGRLDDVEEEVFERPRRELMRTILDLKLDVSSLRRVTMPQRDAVGRLARREFPQITESLAYKFRDVHDHLVRLTDEGLYFQDRITSLISDYTRALIHEASWLGNGAGARMPIHTIFFGGGTPSLLLPVQIQEILTALAEVFEILENAEITLEVNPGTVSFEYLQSLRQMGINRLSLGMQSASPEELRLLERQHDFRDVTRAVYWARVAGFDNLNLDLIFGLPEQTLDSWQRNLELALGLKPDHFSLYALTLEHGTPLSNWADRGLIPLRPDPDLAAEMNEYASMRLEEIGYIQYEISNWATTDRTGQPMACRHNLQYWRNLPYLGLGAGAHGYARGVRRRWQKSHCRLAASPPHT